MQIGYTMHGGGVFSRSLRKGFNISDNTEMIENLLDECSNDYSEHSNVKDCIGKSTVKKVQLTFSSDEETSFIHDKKLVKIEPILLSKEDQGFMLALEQNFKKGKFRSNKKYDEQTLGYLKVNHVTPLEVNILKK